MEDSSDDEFIFDDYGLDTPRDALNRYSIKSRIGKGAYGTVYEAKDRLNGETVAIKIIENIFQTRSDAKRTLREISILRQCNHKNICHIRNVMMPPNPASFNNLWVIQDYGGWDLSRVVKNSRKISGWSAAHVKFIVYQLLCGLLYMQSGRIVHRDLKPSNILMNEQCDLKIIDFGLARQIDTTYYNDNADDIAKAGLIYQNDETETKKNDSQKQESKEGIRELTTHVVTRWYRAPELCLLQNHYNAAIDMWSVGCIMAELLQTLNPENVKPRPLFPGSACFPLSNRGLKAKDAVSPDEMNKETHQLQRIFSIIGTPSPEDIEYIENPQIRDYLKSCEKRAPISFKHFYPYIEDNAIDLLEKMLIFNPFRRITVKEAIEHQYVKQVRRPAKEVVIDHELKFDFETLGSMTIEQEKQVLRDHIIAECYLYNNSNPGK